MGDSNGEMTNGPDLVGFFEKRNPTNTYGNTRAQKIVLYWKYRPGGRCPNSSLAIPSTSNASRTMIYSHIE
jgi:formylmethanofuran dehydrogenase subunit B